MIMGGNMRWIDIVFLSVIITGVVVYYFLKTGVEKSNSNISRRDKFVLKFLESKGYELDNYKTSSVINMTVNNKSSDFPIVYNFSVKKDSRKYLVIIRTTEESERITNPALRNRLFLLFSIFRPHALLLVNPDTEKIQEVKFQFNKNMPNFRTILLISAFIIIVWVLFVVKAGGIL